MTVYFVYRSHYRTPTLNDVRRFEDDSVLAWFRRHWVGLQPEEAYDHVERLFGRRVYGFGSLFEAIAEHALRPPASDAALAETLEEHLYVEGALRCRPHLIQVLTDDDELEMAYYFFDDHFLSRHGDRAAFLLHENWLLPAGEGAGFFKPRCTPTKLKPPVRRPGCTYLAFLAYYDSHSLGNLDGAWSVPGVRLPELPRYLATSVPPSGWTHEGRWPFELRLLRSQLLLDPPKAARTEQGLLSAIRDNPVDPLPWLAHSDWLEEHGHSRNGILERALRGAGNYPVGHIGAFDTRSVIGTDPAEARQLLEQLMQAKKPHRSLNNDPSKSRVQTEDHVAQLVLHTERWGSMDLYHRWILFDDLWASAQPVLANAILRYASRWDVLS
jgi:uncharacterized protein (TIGR02996 family)